MNDLDDTLQRLDKLRQALDEQRLQEQWTTQMRARVEAQKKQIDILRQIDALQAQLDAQRGE